MRVRSCERSGVPVDIHAGVLCHERAGIVGFLLQFPFAFLFCFFLGGEIFVGD